MSRRSQSRRRRTYGRRQHEVRERREDTNPGAAWLGNTESAIDADWQVPDSADEHEAYGEAFGGYSQ